jgi:hypothetical protein
MGRASSRKGRFLAKKKKKKEQEGTEGGGEPEISKRPTAELGVL